MGYTHTIGDNHRKVAEQLAGFFPQVRLNLPKYKNGLGDKDSQIVEVPPWVRIVAWAGNESVIPRGQ
jgi:hypothetical protein